MQEPSVFRYGKYVNICIMVMSTMTVSANAFDDLKDDLKDDQALKLAAGYLVANEV